jgi:intracellular sulfur oxidation DsrE/DsrF family protein
MRNVLLAVFLGLFALAVRAGYVEPPVQLAKYPAQKVVYHLNSGDAAVQSAVLTNVLHHMGAVEGGEFVVVIHNDAVFALRETGGVAATNDLLDRLRAKGAVIRVCNTSLRGRDLDYRALHGVGATDLVSSGVAALGDYQRRGYVYLKP